MLGLFRVEKLQVRELIIPLYCGTGDCLYMEDMMAKRGLVICINAALRTRSTNGKKSKVMVFNHSIDLGILQSSFRIQCLFLEAGMDTTLWMTSSSTVFSQTTGTKYTEPTDLLLSRGIDTQQLSAAAISTSLVA